MQTPSRPSPNGTARTPQLPRRAFLVGAAGSLALAACGGGGDGGTGAARATTLEHGFGTTRVPADPARVVSYGYTDVDTVLALGTFPVLVQEWIPEWEVGVGPWSERALEDRSLKMAAGTDIQFERIAAARPDLILGVNLDLVREDYDKLTQIAPTVPPPENFPPYGAPWQVQARLIGRALGQAPAAERLVDDAEARFAKAKADLPALEGRTGMVVAAEPGGGFSVFADTDNRGRFLSALGLTQPDEIAELVGDDFFAEVSAERTDLLESVDVLVVFADRVGTREIGRTDAYRDAVIVRDPEVGRAMSASTVTAIPFALDRLMPGIAERLA